MCAFCPNSAGLCSAHDSLVAARAARPGRQAGVSLSLLPFHSIHSCIRTAEFNTLLATPAVLEIALVASEFIHTQGLRLPNRRTRFRVWRERESRMKGGVRGQSVFGIHVRKLGNNSGHSFPCRTSTSNCDELAIEGIVLIDLALGHNA